MKTFFILLTLITLNQKAIAFDRADIAGRMQLVRQKLNDQVFGFPNRLIHFELSNSTAKLAIQNDICPQRPGMISCKAMPITVLKNEYNLELVKTDSCGVKTYVSPKVKTPSPLNAPSEVFSMIQVKDNTQSICERIYAAQYEVTLKMSLNEDTTSFDSSLLFNELLTAQE